MTKRMLIDATHAEETRVAVIDGNRLVDFDYESAVRKQLKGSIFLAKVTRVEPSLQAAFVNFGGNRHGFLPFTEIHPDYYRIPIADREAILAEQEREMEARIEAESEDSEDDQDDEAVDEDADEESDEEADEEVDADVDGNVKAAGDEASNSEETEGDKKPSGKGSREGRGRGGRNYKGNKGRGRGRGRMAAHSSRRVEIVGGDAIEGDQPVRPSIRRNYKIQEVVKRGQIMLIQVSKEERGNKGAAVGTYLSLPGRYCVLMPNSPRAGGVSRKIANFKERKRMREILNELKVPQGMSVIMRTAGVSRTKAEVKRDLDYLLRLWDNIRGLTLESSAPAMVHEEGALIRRSIRDIYNPDMEELCVAGEEGFKKARDFMKMMIPSHAKKVKEYKDEKIPLFNRYQVESQINDTSDPVVTLPSGGYLVINPTEALVSIDVNSGKATKERHIEETALKTNLESADEVARQLRLRDLGGLVVIDFIDMEDRRNNRKVENRMKEALSNERARIQIGRISSFGLMELSRQRLNPSLTEAQYEKCPHCLGIGAVRTIDAAAITALRALEEEGIRGRSKEVVLQLPNGVAIYILNNKRDQLADIEKRYGFSILIRVDEELAPSRFLIEPAKTDGTGKAEDKAQSSSDKEDGDRQSRGGRRRGRRGGRQRNNKFEKNTPSQSAEGQSEKNKSVAKEPPKQGESQIKEEKKGEAKGDKKPQSKSDKTVKPSPVEEKKKQTKADSVKKEDDKKTEDKVDKKEKAAPKPRKAAVKKAPAKKEAVKKETAKKAEPSNDTVPQNKDYEVVNEQPTKKKKGWWNKLTD